MKANSKRCNAKTRNGAPCQRFVLKAIKNGRCRLHGGLSTGARTAVGKQRQLAAKLKHGYYTQEAIEQRRHLHKFFQNVRYMIKQIKS